MDDGTYGTNLFAKHTGNIAGRIYCNGVEAGGKAGFLRANRHAGAALYTGIPSNVKNNRLLCTHH